MRCSWSVSRSSSPSGPLEALSDAICSDARKLEAGLDA